MNPIRYHILILKIDTPRPDLARQRSYDFFTADAVEPQQEVVKFVMSSESIFLMPPMLITSFLFFSFLLVIKEIHGTAVDRRHSVSSDRKIRIDDPLLSVDPSVMLQRRWTVSVKQSRISFFKCPRMTLLRLACSRSPLPTAINTGTRKEQQIGRICPTWKS